MNAQDGQDLQDFLSTDTDCISVGSCCSSPDFYPPFSSPACVSPLALSCQMKKRLSPLAPPAPSRVPEGGMQLTAAAAGTGRFHHRSALCCATQVCPPRAPGCQASAPAPARLHPQAPGESPAGEWGHPGEREHCQGSPLGVRGLSTLGSKPTHPGLGSRCRFMIEHYSLGAMVGQALC